MNDKNKYDLVIFDCDGTLADSEYLNCLSCSEIFIEAGYARYTYDVIYNEFVGVTLADIVKIVEEQTNTTLPDDMIERVIRRVEINAPTYLKSIKGVSEAVEWANERYKICVASNGEPTNVKSSIRVLGLSEMLPKSQIFTSAMVKKGKPEPDLFLLAAKKMKCDPARTIVIEDTQVGIRAAKTAGMTAIGFTQMHQNDEGYTDKLMAAGADHIMNKWSQFYDLIDK